LRDHGARSPGETRGQHVGAQARFLRRDGVR
jgi:hypothetical protein